ncbi:uncharacterized protein LOC135499606 [Lineus longissimus]|uniref:uncharacterized protein LOC135499606 n=1 Tax=Lineus longissimus TaxID=88925 RepID=UPI002B4CCE99
MFRPVVLVALIVYVLGEERPQIDAVAPAARDCDISKMTYSYYSRKYELRMADPCAVKLCTKDGKHDITLTCPETYQHDSGCVDSQSGAPGKCYMALQTNKQGVFPICCPKYKEMCEGQAGFDPSRVKDCYPQEDVLLPPGH